MELTTGQLAEYELRAKMAERERCAKIADQLARANDILNDGDDAAGAIAAAKSIAALIRE